MAFYTIDTDQLAVDMLPPDKRDTLTVALTRASLKAMQREIWTALDDLQNGSGAPSYVAGSYDKYEQVVYNYAVYESLEDSNTALPDDATKWKKLLNSFIGTNTAIKFDSTKLLFEYGLNYYFGTQFLQPPALSDIYIVTNTPDINVFRVGSTESTSSSVGLTDSTEYVTDTYNFTTFYQFTIFVPIAVYTLLGSNADTIIRNFADKYCATSLTYDIQTY
jgi:hypothetical protein